MEKSESIKNIAGALVEFQKLVGKIGKGSVNPFFKSKYAALPDILNAIHTPLIESGLTVNQFPTGVNGLTTIVIHSESGEYLMDTYFMKPTKDDPQGLGSCITYARRYAIGAALNLNIDEDDDGNKASAPKAEVKKDVPVALPYLVPGLKAWNNAAQALADGKTIQDIQVRYQLTPDHAQQLMAEAMELTPTAI